MYSIKIFKFLFYITLISLFIIVINQFMYPIVGMDSGYYLAIAREFYQGKVYFYEIGTTYTPLSIITAGLPFLFDEQPDFRWHVLVIIMIQIGTSLIFYKILSVLTDLHVYQKIFFSSFLLLLNFTFEGLHIMLEPLSVFFQILTIYFYLLSLKEFKLFRGFLIGFFIALSFLSKQYGLFVLIPIGIDMIIRKEWNYKKWLSIFVGFSVPFLFFYFYLYNYNVEIKQFIEYLLGKGTISDFKYVELNYFNWSRIKVFLYINHYIFIIPILIVIFYKKMNYNLLLLLLIFSFTPLYFATFGHYFLYIIPYALLLFAYTFNFLDKKLHITNLAFILLITSVVFAIKPHRLIFYGRSKKVLDAQNLVKKNLFEEIPIYSKVFLVGISPAHYYINNYNSINLKRIGFSFPENEP